MYVYIYTYPSSSEESFQCQTFLAGSIGETFPEKNNNQNTNPGSFISFLWKHTFTHYTITECLGRCKVHKQVAPQYVYMFAICPLSFQCDSVIKKKKPQQTLIQRSNLVCIFIQLLAFLLKLMTAGKIASLMWIFIHCMLHSQEINPHWLLRSVQLKQGC